MTIYREDVNMNLNEIRTQIDKMDRELLALFQNRMNLCRDVAAYKKANHLPIFQEEREKQIRGGLAGLAPPDDPVCPLSGKMASAGGGRRAGLRTYWYCFPHGRP